MLFVEMFDVSYFLVAVAVVVVVGFDGTVIKFECIDLMWAPDANTKRTKKSIYVLLR